LQAPGQNCDQNLHGVSFMARGLPRPIKSWRVNALLGSPCQLLVGGWAGVHHHFKGMLLCPYRLPRFVGLGGNLAVRPPQQNLWVKCGPNCRNFLGDKGLQVTVSRCVLSIGFILLSRPCTISEGRLGYDCPRAFSCPLEHRSLCLTKPRGLGQSPRGYRLPPYPQILRKSLAFFRRFR